LDAQGRWSLKTAKKRHRFDYHLAARIGELWAPKQFADLGCGNGRYCAVFKAYGWPVVHGYEGTQRIISLGIYEDIFILDLTIKRWVEIPYDLVMCLEVGEHIPKKYEQIFIDNVCDFAIKDLILSWGIPGQGGKGHVNEQPNDYVVNELYRRGFRYDKGRTRDLRAHSSLKWFKDTIMVFFRG
jgi:hypothetical protein